MTHAESLKVLAVLTAAFPRYDLPRETAQLWLAVLSNFHAKDAEAAAMDVVNQDEWFPTIARFRQLVAAHRRARELRASETRGLPDGHSPVPPNPELIAATRRMLAMRATKRHDHHGPNPCPACGALPPEAAS